MAAFNSLFARECECDVILLFKKRARVTPIIWLSGQAVETRVGRAGLGAGKIQAALSDFAAPVRNVGRCGFAVV